jgi:hypothetical protein
LVAIKKVEPRFDVNDRRYVLEQVPQRIGLTFLALTGTLELLQKLHFFFRQSHFASFVTIGRKAEASDPCTS